MRRKGLSDAKLVVTIKSNKGEKTIETISVFDNRTNSQWIKERITERGIEKFLNLEDMKETLNWNLNGNSSRFQFKWGQSSKSGSGGMAWIFD